MRTRERTAWPKGVSQSTPHPPPPSSVGRGEVIAVTFIGHSTFLIRTAWAVILTDPVFTSHAGPFGRMGPPRRASARHPRPSAASRDQSTWGLVSHNHYDHLQPSSLRRCAQGAEPQFVTPLGLGPFLRRLTLQNVIELDWWEAADLGAGCTVTCVPAQHFSARTPFDRNRTLWCGFVLAQRNRDDLLRRRLRVLVRISRRLRRRCPADRPRAAADRRLRAALVHAPGAHESRGGGAGTPRHRRARQPRHALRHVPTHRRSDRRATRGSGPRPRHAASTARSRSTASRTCVSAATSAGVLWPLGTSRQDFQREQVAGSRHRDLESRQDGDRFGLLRHFRFDAR